MLAYIPSRPSGHPGAEPFARCEQLFSCYPLAAAPHCDGRGSRSMILMARAEGEAEFFVLTETDHAFYIRSWNSGHEAVQGITPGEPVAGTFARVIAHGMPVPQGHAVLGWAPDRQVTAILAVHGVQSADAGRVPAVPAIQIMPLSGTVTIDWPPFGTNLLGHGRLWDYLERGDIVDVAPLLASCPGRAFRTPCAHGHGSLRGAACVVVTANLVARDYWLPTGVYTDHWVLREGIPVPPAGQLLALPGTVDMAHELRMTSEPESGDAGDQV